MRRYRETFAVGWIVLAASCAVEEAPPMSDEDEHEHEHERVIVRFKPHAVRGEIERAHKLRTKDAVGAIDAVVYDVDAEDTGPEVVERVKWLHHDALEYIEIDQALVPAYVATDPRFSSEWHLPKIGATTAWDVAKGGGVTVANLDTGTNCAHPDLAANCVPGWNTANNTSDTSDLNGHGTMTAGTLASVGDNGIGGVGVAFQSELMPLRIAFDSTGTTSCSAIANGIIWAADHGARVASNSYKVTGCSVINDAATYLAAKGGVYVRAAGNDNVQLTELNQQNVVIVSATDANDLKTSWSSYGSTVDIAAPGEPIYCTLLSGSYGTCWGTSFSVPIVSGVLALMFSVNPELSAEQAKAILFSTAVDLGTAGWDPTYGHGRVDAARAVALAAATAGSGATDTLAPSVPQNLAASGLTASAVTLTWSASIDNVAVTGYDVYRNGVRVGTASGTSYTNPGLAANTTYVYRVAARDAAGNASAQSGSLSVTTPSAPFAITNTAVLEKTATSAVVSIATSGPSTVVVSYGTSATGAMTSATSSVVGERHEVLLSGLDNKTRYFYTVTATSSGGPQATAPVSNFRTPNR